jgi:DNA-binding FadR family transcriptional regulator
MSGIEPLTRNRSMSARIAEQILAKIETGEFAVGDKLPPEMQLAKAFGVSRPSVREALGALQFVGYIESVRGSGNRVVRSTPASTRDAANHLDGSSRTVLDLFEARLRIEPEVAAVAAENPDHDKLDEVDALIEGMLLAVHEPTLQAETDLLVHRGIAAVCQNQFLRVATINLIEIAASDKFSQSREEAWGDQVLPSIWASQHQKVTNAIRDRDPASAAHASWAHMASSVSNALNVLSADASVAEQANRLAALLDRGPKRTA